MKHLVLFSAEFPCKSFEQSTKLTAKYVANHLNETLECDATTTRRNLRDLLHLYVSWLVSGGVWQAVHMSFPAPWVLYRCTVGTRHLLQEISLMDSSACKELDLKVFGCKDLLNSKDLRELYLRQNVTSVM